jgi:hypothetical protein
MRLCRIPLILAGFPILAAVLCDCGNPLLTAFLSTFEIENRSGQTVSVTPIGMTEGQGHIAPLPRYDDKGDIPQRHLQRTRIVLDPGETVHITYDMDDINFRHILVRTVSGHVRLLDTDKRGTLSLCYGAHEKVYVIPSLDMIPEAPVELLPCENGATVKYEPLRVEYARPIEETSG